MDGDEVMSSTFDRFVLHGRPDEDGNERVLESLLSTVVACDRERFGPGLIFSCEEALFFRFHLMPQALHKSTLSVDVVFVFGKQVC